mgnify:CR=1 FL=1
MKKEYFTIPNLMGYFRILLIPVFCVLYYHSENAGCFYGAVPVFFIFLFFFYSFMGRLLFYVFRFCRIFLTGKLQDIFIR